MRNESKEEIRGKVQITLVRQRTTKSLHVFKEVSSA